MANIILKNKQGDPVTYEGITTVSFDTPEEGVQAVFSEGVTAEKEVDLDFGAGNMEVTPAAGTLLTKIVVVKPENYIPENIRNGVNLGGVVGTMTGAENLPQLNPVTISRTSNVVTITNPATNGNFVEKYRVYNSGKYILEVVDNTFNVETLDDGGGEYSIAVAAVSDKFLESELSAPVTATMRAVSFTLENLHIDTESVVLDGLAFSTVLIPDDGYYLPEYIQVTVDGVAVDFTYDSYSGEVTIPNVTANPTITASAYDYPKLRIPTLEIDGQTAVVTPPAYADHTYVYGNDVLIETIVSPARWWVEQVEDADYGFTLNSSGYYESQNKGVANSYAIAKVMIYAAEESTVTLKCINYAESSNDYGILSTLDAPLTLSAVADSENVAQSFKGSSSSSVQSVTYTVPQGTHCVYVKFIKDSSTNSNNDSLRVTVSV